MAHSSVEAQDVVRIQNDEAVLIQNELGPDYEKVLAGAQAAAAHQQQDLGVVAAFRKHWKAALWSLGLSTALVMEGYDVVVINSFYGSNAFIHRFGTVLSNGEKVITAPWQTGLSNSALVGEVMGLLLQGWASDRWGYRPVYMASMVFMTLTIFIPVFAQSLPMLSAGEVLMGIPWGVFQTLTTTYAAEICPIMLRPYMTSYVCFCWGLGIFLSSIVVRATLNMAGQWAWRMPFALQWVWPVPLFLVAYFAPESPWHYSRKGQFEDAKNSLRRMQTTQSGEDESHIEDQICLMRHTNALEKAEQAGASYFECFRRDSLRRTFLVCIVYSLQWWCGNPLMSYAVTFFRRAGLSQDNAFNLNIIMNTTYMIGTVLSWFLLRAMGRRTLYLSGAVACCIHLITIGALGFFDSTSISWGIGSLLITFALAYNCTIGPGAYTIIAEIPSSRLLAKSIVLARLTYVLTGLVTNTLTPRMLSPDAWNWGSKGAFLYLGTCSMILVILFFQLPESRNRTTAEMDELFAQGIPARKFASAELDLYYGNQTTTLPYAPQNAHSLDGKDDEKDGGVRTVTAEA
ncbi:related to Maltose permease [Ustilago trichophora]|uniref:Related to Maltose permease n=1 Tax=Ustilago trichophora TaxID=86804 RepID=A0A5C3EFR2_9BASI|nr:related to Maltose permease [Ustilago trichophora]